MERALRSSNAHSSRYISIRQRLRRKFLRGGALRGGNSSFSVPRDNPEVRIVRIPVQLTAKITNLLSSADGLLHLFEGLSIGAGVLTVAALIGIAVTSRTVSKQNKTAFEQLKGSVAKQQGEASNARAAQQRVETELAEAKTRQAEAETKLEEVRKRQGPRQFDIHMFSKALENKPRCPIEIVCQPNDIEAYNLAELIFLMLNSANWTIDPSLLCLFLPIWERRFQ